MLERYLVGIIEVPLSAFTTEAGVGRDEDKAIVKRLSRVLRKAPARGQHPIKGLIDRQTLSTVASSLGLSIKRLRETTRWPKYPRVNLRSCVLCVDGKQRIAAARKTFGKNSWWPVELYYVSEKYRGALIDHQVREYFHQTKYSDGDIYRNIRHCETNGQDRAAREWRLQLSEPKEHNLNLLEKKKDIVAALDELLPIPALWGGLQLGNFNKYVALHWDDQIITYMKHIKTAWSHITDKDEALQQAIDVRDVRDLEGRAPCVKTDRIYIRTIMERGQLFQRVQDVPTRRRLLRNILTLREIIPSIQTFHENMKYFSIGARILTRFVVAPEQDLRRLLLPKPKQDRRHPPLPEQDPKLLTVSEWLDGHWRRSSNVLIQSEKNKYNSVVNFGWTLVLKEIFLFALRNFPHLSNDRPLQDQRGEVMPAGVDEAYVASLQERARQLGILTPEIVKTPMRNGKQADLKKFCVPDPFFSVWKFGKPPLRSFLCLQSDAFLPALQDVSVDEMTPLFVQNDFLNSFFGIETLITDKEGLEIDIDLRPTAIPTTRKEPAVNPLRQGKGRGPSKVYRIQRPSQYNQKSNQIPHSQGQHGRRPQQKKLSATAFTNAWTKFARQPVQSVSSHPTQTHPLTLASTNSEGSPVTAPEPQAKQTITPQSPQKPPSAPTPTLNAEESPAVSPPFERGQVSRPPHPNRPAPTSVLPAERPPVNSPQSEQIVENQSPHSETPTSTSTPQPPRSPPASTSVLPRERSPVNPPLSPPISTPPSEFSLLKPPPKSESTRVPVLFKFETRKRKLPRGVPGDETLGDDVFIREPRVSNPKRRKYEQVIRTKGKTPQRTLPNNIEAQYEAQRIELVTTSQRERSPVAPPREGQATATQQATTEGRQRSSTRSASKDGTQARDSGAQRIELATTSQRERSPVEPPIEEGQAPETFSETRRHPDWAFDWELDEDGNVIEV